MSDINTLAYVVAYVDYSLSGIDEDLAEWRKSVNHMRVLENWEMPFIMPEEGISMYDLVHNAHIHDADGNCAKNRYGPRCPSPEK